MPRYLPANADAPEAVRILLCQLDGAFPNLALMRISAHHKALGDDVELRPMGNMRAVERGIFDDFGRVYASLIFRWNRPVAERLKHVYPDAIIGGSGWDRLSDVPGGQLVAISKRRAESEVTTIEQYGITTTEKDYSLYPAFRNSIGFTQRGCRMQCGFCHVPVTEGKVRAEATIADIWRGDPWPKNLILWDNDTFGAKDWRRTFADIRDGGFKVSFNQGVNARLMNEENAEALAATPCYNPEFTDRRWYTAWDNKDDEEILFRGLRHLVKYGVRPDQIMVYMLIGYQAGETHAHREERRIKLREFGCRPYPMAYAFTTGNLRELKGYQRWVIRREDLKCTWEEFASNNYRPEGLGRAKDDLPLLVAC